MGPTNNPGQIVVTGAGNSRGGGGFRLNRRVLHLWVLCRPAGPVRAWR